MANLTTGTPAMQVQTLPLEGPRILKEGDFLLCTIVNHHLAPPFGLSLEFFKEPGRESQHG